VSGGIARGTGLALIRDRCFEIRFSPSLRQADYRLAEFPGRAREFAGRFPKRILIFAGRAVLLSSENPYKLADGGIEGEKSMATAAAINGSQGNPGTCAAHTDCASLRASRALVSSRRRRISREAGRAIEMLGHAIEYLADEFALDCMMGRVEPYRGTHPRIAAIELLKARNREIFLSCPQAPSLADRLRALWSLLRV
jgi:hypothetical protein